MVNWLITTTTNHHHHHHHHQSWAGEQANLGTMYYNGDGVARDLEEASRLFRLAAAQGEATAAQYLNLMEMDRRKREVHGDEAEL